MSRVRPQSGDYGIFRKISAFAKEISRIAYQSDMAFCVEKPYAYTQGISIIYYSIFGSKSRYKSADKVAISIDISGDITGSNKQIEILTEILRQ